MVPVDTSQVSTVTATAGSLAITVGSDVHPPVIHQNASSIPSNHTGRRTQRRRAAGKAPKRRRSPVRCTKPAPADAAR
jgi:hypothetical protein